MIYRDSPSRVIDASLNEDKVLQIELRGETTGNHSSDSIHCGGEEATFLILSVKEIENIYSQQESLYIDNVIKCFYENWWAVNLGAEKVSRFISFSQLSNPSLFEGYFLFKSKLFRSAFHERSIFMLCYSFY